MRYLLTSALVNFRSTLSYFENRDRAMLNFHPKIFPHWRRGPSDFNLIDTDNRKVIRFEPNKFVIRTEGHDSLEQFNECLDISMQMLKDLFKIFDIFYVQIESFQIKSEKNLSRARKNFANKFLSSDSTNILPLDKYTDYQLSFERTEDVNNSFAPVTSPFNKTLMKLRRKIFIGPVSKNEVVERWLEFKEGSDLVQYQTKAPVPEFGQLLGINLSIRPIEGIKQFSLEIISRFSKWAIEDANSIWEKSLGA